MYTIRAPSGSAVIRFSLYYYLSHFVHFPFPAQSLVVQRVVVRADEYRLPVQMIAGPLARVEHAHAGLWLGAGPFLELGHGVTVGTHFFVERDGRTVFQHRQLRKNHKNILQQLYVLKYIIMLTFTRI